MKFTPLLALVLSFVLITGCDPMCGVVRQARVPFMPEPASIASTIRATPGVDDVDYGWTLNESKPPDQIYWFEYRGGTNIHGSIYFGVDCKRQVIYRQSFGHIGRLSQSELDAMHPVMLEIEKRLATDCGLTNLPSDVVEDRNR